MGSPGVNTPVRRRKMEAPTGSPHLQAGTGSCFVFWRLQGGRSPHTRSKSVPALRPPGWAVLPSQGSHATEDRPGSSGLRGVPAVTPFPSRYPGKTPPSSERPVQVQRPEASEGAPHPGGPGSSPGGSTPLRGPGTSPGGSTASSPSAAGPLQHRGYRMLSWGQRFLTEESVRGQGEAGARVTGRATRGQSPTAGRSRGSPHTEGHLHFCPQRSHVV